MSDDIVPTHNIWVSYCIPLLKRIGKTNDKYYDNYKRYIKWLEGQLNNDSDNRINVFVEYTQPEETGDPIFPLYITQNNVEMYFRYEVAVNHNGQRATVRGTFDSLRTIGTKYENIRKPPILLSLLRFRFN